MQLATILNHVEKNKSFVYGDGYWVGEGDYKEIHVPVFPRKNSRGECSVCGKRGPTYDHLAERRFQFLPVFWIPVFFVYAPRRIDCKHCGVKVENIPWAQGKSPLTWSFMVYLADWAKVLSWQEVARRFDVAWAQVFESVSKVVEWGLDRRDISNVTAVGVDEVHFGKGQRYITVLYQLCGDTHRLLAVGLNRESATLEALFDELGDQWREGVRYVCSDMWKPFMKAIREKLPQAVNILDRFHIVKMLNEAVDEVRKEEAAKLRKEGVDLLTGLKYVFLKRPENLTDNQRDDLLAILSKRWLRTVRAYLWKMKFEVFWQYASSFYARRFLRSWCSGAMRSRLEPIKKFVKTLRAHEELLMNWFDAKKLYSSGVVEGLNRRVNLITRKSYGYKSFEVLRIALLHVLGGLPEPQITHRF